MTLSISRQRLVEIAQEACAYAPELDHVARQGLLETARTMPKVAVNAWELQDCGCLGTLHRNDPSMMLWNDGAPKFGSTLYNIGVKFDTLLRKELMLFAEKEPTGVDVVE